MPLKKNTTKSNTQEKHGKTSATVIKVSKGSTGKFFVRN